jgi:hypothetical protein
MTNKWSWRKSSFSISNDACVEVSGTLDAVRDSKAVGQMLPVRGVPQLVRHIKDGKFAR